MTPDLAQADAFLRLLDPDATSFTFQTFDDNADRKDASLTQVLLGSLADHAATLTDLQRRGAGVFITINETDGTGRKTENITRVRALWLDMDGAPIEPVREWETPHIQVESSPGRWHPYWLVDDVTLDDFKPIQTALIQKFNGDPSVKDLPRVMRLPGFWHLKAGRDPFMSRLVHSSSHEPLHAADFTTRLTVEASVMPTPRSETPVDLAEVEELLTHISPDIEGDAGGDKHWHTLIASIADVSGGSDAGMQVADEWSSRSKHYDPKELRKRYQSFKPGKVGGVGIGTIRHHAKLGGADHHEISARHRLLSMSRPDYLPAGASMEPQAAAPSAVDMILARVADNPTTAVSRLAGEIARLPVADRDRVLAECKLHDIKTEMQAAVKRALAEYAVAKGADTAAINAAGPLSHYFIVENEFGQPVAMDRRGGLQPQSRAAFRDAKAALPSVMLTDASGNVRAKAAADHWWEAPETPRYHATGYDPLADVEYDDDQGRKLRNVYQTGHDAPAMPVIVQSVEPFLYIIRSNFPDAGDQQTLLRAIAHMVQHPGVMLRWAPVMQGTPGCGKSTIAEAVAYCHGPNNVSHPSPDVIARDFNDYMYRRTLIVVNEIGDHTKRELSALSEKMKPWVTDSPVHIEPKGKTGFQSPNHVNWIFTTNHLHCMLATPGERRYAHFISALQTEDDAASAFYPGWWSGAVEDADWWASYYDWWRAGGAEAVRGYLSHMFVGVLSSRAPVTSTTAMAMHAGDGAALGLIREAIAEGAAGFRGGWVSINAVRDLLEGEDIKIPAGQFLARQLEQIGYRKSVKVHTSPSETMRFPRAPSRSRLYHVEDMSGDSPATMMAMYDSAQRAGDDGTDRGNIINMPRSV